MKCTPVESQETARKTDLGPLVYEACHAESITEQGYFTSVDIKVSTSKNIRTRKKSNSLRYIQGPSVCKSAGHALKQRTDGPVRNPDVGVSTSHKKEVW